MNTKEKTKLLTLGLMCCGRPETTERCLQSLVPIREAIDAEIQVVDTGCSKETRAIIEKYADEVFEFTWCNDFAAARNFQLDQANGKVFLYLDDDEWFLEPEMIIKHFKSEGCLDFKVGGYYQRNYLDFDGKEFQDTIVTRMTVVTPETKFIGKVHEYIDPSDGNAIYMDVHAGHFGYVYVSDEDNRKHSMRNVPLIKEMMEEQPDNLRWPYQLAQEYKSIYEFDNLYEVCKNAYQQSLLNKENDAIKYRGNFVCGMALALQKMEKEDELLELFNAECNKPDIMELPIASLAYYAAVVLFKQKNNAKCKEACELYLKIVEASAGNTGKKFIEGGLFIDDIFEDIKSNTIYCYLMTIGMDDEDYGPLTHYYRRINWGAKVVRLNRGFMITLLDKSAAYGYKSEISKVLDKFFTSYGFRKLIEDLTDEVAYTVGEQELLNLKDAFKNTSGKKEMAAYMDVRLMEYEFSQIAEWGTLGELINALQQYIAAVNDWKKIHDSWLVEEDITDTVPRDLQLANGLQQFMDICETNVSLALKNLKNLFGLRKTMNIALGELSRLYVAAIKVDDIRRNQPEKFQEMYALEEQVLQQISDLDVKGQEQEAIALYKQLVGILKSTFDVETLHV